MALIIRKYVTPRPFRNLAKRPLKVYTFYAQLNDGSVKRIVISTPGLHSMWLEWDAEVTKVWQEGPKGGVKLIRNTGIDCKLGFITKNAEAMKEFTWVKLSAVDMIAGG